MTRLATPEIEAKAQDIANRHGGGAIAYQSALAGLLDNPPIGEISTAEHMLSWAENSQPHWRRLKEVCTRGDFIRSQGQAIAAANLASTVASHMIEAGDLSRMDLEPADILDAAKLFLSWKPEPENSL